MSRSASPSEVLVRLRVQRNRVLIHPTGFTEFPRVSPVPFWRVLHIVGVRDAYFIYPRGLKLRTAEYNYLSFYPGKAAMDLYQ